MNHGYFIGIIMIMAIITFSLRALPFILFKNRQFKFIDFLGGMMPPGIMIILVFYSFLPSKEVNIYYYIEFSAASLCVIILHHFFRNPLLSILPGTGLYITLQYIPLVHS